MTMPHRRPARKRWLLLPYLVVLVLAAAWCVGWFFLKSETETRLASLRREAGNGGYVLTWSEQQIGGFPFRLFVRLKEVRFSEPSGWGLTATNLETEAAAYAPQRIVAAAPNGIVLTRPSKGPLSIKGEVLRASVSGYPNALRLSVEGVNLTFAPVEGGRAAAFTSAERFGLHLRPQPDDRMNLALQLQGARPSGGDLLARLVGHKAAGLRLEGSATRASAMRARSWASGVQSWASAGGTFELSIGEAVIGDAVARSSPTRLGVGPRGSLEGPVSLTLGSGPEAMVALGATGVLPPETASVAAGLAGIASPGGQASARLDFRDGQTFLGPLPIGPAPRLY